MRSRRQLLMAVFAVLAIAAFGATVARSNRVVWVERETVLMGTYLQVSLAVQERDAGIRIIDEVFDAVEIVDALISSWRDDSEIGILNAASAGERVQISNRLLKLLGELADWVQSTDGAFDPAIGSLIDAWDLRGDGRVPDANMLMRALTASGIANVSLDKKNSTARRSSGATWLDAGAFGKGYALRDVAQLLRERGVKSALIDFGGQALAIGNTRSHDRWTIGVANPTKRDESVAVLRIRDESAATSSQSERFVEVAGKRFGHVLDPRTGQPVEPWGSVTVVAQDPMVADILSTALFVLGAEVAEQWARDRIDVGVLILVNGDDGVEFSWNKQLDPYFEPREH